MWWLDKLPNVLRKFFSFREQQESGDVVKPFLDHLEDLRVMLIKMGFTVGIAMVVAFLYSQDLLYLMQAPLRVVNPALLESGLDSLTVVEPFMITLKLAFFAGLVFAFPILLYFAAEFVLPALTRKEKRLLFPAVGVGFILFAAGALLCYYYILPHTLKWFYDYAISHNINPKWRANDYFSFVTHLTIACGLLSELPVVVLALSVLGIVSYRLLSNTRPYAVTMILILVAIISPTPDPFTFIALSVPVVAIYEICIWIVWLMEKRRRKAELSPMTIPE